MRDEPVIICAHCGVGFLRNPGSKIHPYPVWAVSIHDGGPTSGDACGGPLVMRNRRAEIIKLDLQEDKNGRAHHTNV